MDINIKHTQSQDEVKRRLQALIQRLKTEHSDQIQTLNEEWTGYTDNIEGSAKGYSISGTIDVQPTTIDIHLKLPFLLKVFGSKIKSVVEEQVKKELA